METKQEYRINELGCLHLLPDVEDNSVDMILTDLPYGTTQCKWDTVIPFEPLWKEYKRIIKDNGAIVLTASQPFTSALIVSNIDMFKYCWIWEKTQGTGHLNTKKQPMRCHEDIAIFYKNQCVYNPQKTHGHERKTSLIKHKHNTKNNQPEIYSACSNFADYDSTSRFPRSVQIFKSDKQTHAIHPTQKPIALAEYLIKTYTNEGDMVHDSCMGSGWSMEACKNLNRNYIGHEKYNTWEDNYKRILETTPKPHSP